jgi:DNA topoisomerase-1
MTPQRPLRYYPDSRPGISRRRCGRGFCYYAPDGSRITDETERARIHALAVPPAYERVWISPIPNGHLQATGHDSRGRKQYRYHPLWSEAQADTKFASLLEFGAALPRLRRQVWRDLRGDLGERSLALAAAVALLDRLSLRVGNPVYAKENNTFGALTLKRRHLILSDGRLLVAFRSKGGKRVRRQIAHRTLHRALEKIRDLPGAELLTWLDARGEPHALTSAALNAYIAETGGSDGFSAKTFRTWAGTLAAFEVVLKQAEPQVKDLAEAAATRLHNTPAIARTSYIHPEILGLCDETRPLPRPGREKGLSLIERRLLAFLRNVRNGRPRYKNVA